MVVNGCKNFQINFAHMKVPVHNLWQNTLDKFSELSKIDFSVKCCGGDFFFNSTQLSKFSFRVTGWDVFSSKCSRDFVEI